MTLRIAGAMPSPLKLNSFGDMFYFLAVIGIIFLASADGQSSLFIRGIVLRPKGVLAMRTRSLLKDVNLLTSSLKG